MLLFLIRETVVYAILDKEEIILPRQIQQLKPVPDGHARPGRVLIIRYDIEQFDLFANPMQFDELPLQFPEIDAILIYADSLYGVFEDLRKRAQADIAGVLR